MTRLFADTFYFLALRNSKDQHYAAARAISQQVQERNLVTTAWVLTEVADALARPAERIGVSSLLALLKKHGAIVVEPDQPLFERGIELYLARPDKAWTLTDCISFVVMQDHELSEALTGDHHFEQAGFVALLK